MISHDEKLKDVQKPIFDITRKAVLSILYDFRKAWLLSKEEIINVDKLIENILNTTDHSIPHYLYCWMLLAKMGVIKSAVN